MREDMKKTLEKAYAANSACTAAKALLMNAADAAHESDAAYTAYEAARDAYATAYDAAAAAARTTLK